MICYYVVMPNGMTFTIKNSEFKHHKFDSLSEAITLLGEIKQEGWTYKYISFYAIKTPEAQAIIAEVRLLQQYRPAAWVAFVPIPTNKFLKLLKHRVDTYLKNEAEALEFLSD